MKTQISRDSFQPGQRYSGVYLQQGRMILDADWNELSDIQKERLVSALRDAISGTGGSFGGGLSTVAGGAPRIGGLAVYADPAGSANIRLRPGALYVEGVPAGLNPGPALSINAQPDYPLQADYPGKSLVLYADVWERSVSALEQSSLMDAALHGADTATRSQTMLQVKWCSFDPLDTTKNPPIGDAPLTLTLPLIVGSGDACDPCATQVKVGERLGNYLFRVEVHDYDATPGARQLTLKWSRDNGAEACAVAAMPPGFNQGDWVWEFFDHDTERLLGNHFVTNPKKLRGVLSKTYTVPVAADLPKTHVRQWDGYLVINLDSHAIVGGRDRGIDLFPGTAADLSPGRVFCDGTVLRINLELLNLHLTHAGKAFVPGDYWLAEVREAKDESGESVLDHGLPRGVRHHYLPLGELDAGGKLKAGDDAYKRRMNFPPLSDLRAGDIGFTNNCSKLYADASNVQQALDNLCAIDASDIAYPLPNCDTGLGKTIKDWLKSSLDPDADGKLTVQAALDNLLCRLNAASLPYPVKACGSSPSVRSKLGLAPGDNSVGVMLDTLLCDFRADDLPLNKNSELCADLKNATEVETVQDALNYLCAGRTSCVQSVAVGELQKLLEGYAASPERKDLWLCLQPGTHPIDKPISILGKTSLRISALAAGAATIHATGGQLLFEAKELGLEGVYCLFAANSRLRLRADRIVGNRCSFARSSADPELQPMVLIETLKEEGELSWRDNLMSDTWKKAAEATGELVAPDVVGDVAVAEAFGELLGDLVYPENPPLFDKKIAEISALITKLPKETMQAWLTKVNAAAVSGPVGRTAPRVTRSTRTTKAARGVKTAAGPIGRSTVTQPTLATAQPAFATALTQIIAADSDPVSVQAYVSDMVAELLFESGYGVALALADNKLSGSLDDNRIDGELELKNGLGTDGGDPENQNLNKNNHPGITAEGSLSLAGNRIQRLWARVPAGTLKDGAWVGKARGYESLALTGNQLAGYGHSAVAALLTVTGNRLLNGPPKAPTVVVKLLTGNAAISGNSASFADDFTPLFVAGDLAETAANVIAVHKFL